MRDESSYDGYPEALPDPYGMLRRWIEATSITPLSATEWKCREGWFVGPRVLNDSFWYVFPNGRGKCIIAGRELSFGPGSLILVPQGIPHAVRLDPGVRTLHLSVHFHALIWGSLDLLSMLGFPRVVPRTTQTDWEGFSRRLARERALGLAGWQRAMSNAIYDVLLLVIRSHGASFVPPGGAMIAKALPRLLPVFSLIDERIADCQLSIRDCARAIEVSEVYLRGLFRSLTGVPPLEFLQRRRIERACDILRSSDESIKSIAWSVGFTDVPYFYRVFKKWMRTTPASYRARPIR